MITNDKFEQSSSEKINNIVETTFKIGKTPELTSLIKEAFGDYWKKEWQGKFGYIVYIDNDPKQFVLGNIYLPKKTKSLYPFFIDYLKQLKCSDFNDLLLLVSTYPWFKEMKTDPLHPYIGASNNHIDFILKETNGWIIYDYQLQNLYQMATGQNKDKSILFRKNINKKIPAIYSDSKEIELFGATLYELIISRMNLENTCSCNYSGAYKLYCHLNC